MRTRVMRAAARGDPQRQTRQFTEAARVARQPDPDGTAVKVLPTRKTRRLKAPSWQQHQHKRILKADTPSDGARMSRGPAIDTAATMTVVNKQLAKYLKGVHTMAKPVLVKGATGDKLVTQCGSLKVGAITIKKALLIPEAPASVVAARDLTDQGYTYVQSKTQACLVQDDEVIECKLCDTGFAELPVSETRSAVVIEVQAAMQKGLRAAQERARLEQLSHMLHCHMPKCPGCPECEQAKMRRGDGVKGPLQPEQELEVGFDLVGPLVESPDGNVYKLVGVATKTGVGWLEGLPDKAAATVLQGVKTCLARIRLLHKHKPDDKVSVRFHTDQDSSFLSVVQAYADQQVWLRTTTEGYDHNGNSKVERRNEKLQQGYRAVLMSATAGRLQYEELWDAAMQHVGDVINHMPEGTHKTPAMLAGGEELTIEDMMEAFGALTYYYQASERRVVGSRQSDLPGRLGIYVGRSQVINGGHRIMPIEWDTAKQQWRLGATIERAYAKVDNSQFPLRTVPKKGMNTIKEAKDFENFVHGLSPQAMVPDVYVVEKVIEHRKVKGDLEYKVKWRGYKASEATWEPIAHLAGHGAQAAVVEYHKKSKTKLPKAWVTTLTHTIMMLEEPTENELAVEQLLRQAKIGCEGDDFQEWVQAYELELETVLRLRCREIFGDEYKQVMKTQKVVSLRMNPEPKKDKRKKMRLLLKGFMEPQEWTGKKDSPTVMLSTVRTLLAMGTDRSDPDIACEDDDVVSIGDIRTAFLLAKAFGLEEAARYVALKAHKGAHKRLFQLTGPLYGQRDAGYRWWETLCEFLIEQGFQQSKNDLCMFSHPVTKMRLGVHVDDIIARGSRKQTTLFWEQLESKFALKEWDIVDCDTPLTYIGMQVGKQRKGSQVWYTLDMEADIADFLEDAGMSGSRLTTAPMPYKEEILSDTSPVSEQEHKKYMSQVGSLQWYANIRYDIAYEVTRLAQFLSKPTRGAMKALRRVLAYLNSTRDKKLWVPRVGSNRWTLYSDSDHAGDTALGITRSHTGVILLLNGMPIHWRSQKQPKTATSSAAAEIYAMSEAVKDARIRMWVAEDMHMKVTWPMVLHVDNAAGESFQHSTCGTTKLKGIFNLREAWVQELKDEAQVNAVHVDTTKNLADMLTKGLKAEVRNKLEGYLFKISQSVAECA